MYRPSITPQVCGRCRRLHVRGTGDRVVCVTVCPDCDRSGRVDGSDTLARLTDFVLYGII